MQYSHAYLQDRYSSNILLCKLCLWLNLTVSPLLPERPEPPDGPEAPYNGECIQPA